MLEEARLKQLKELVHAFSKEELIWINGYTTGYLAKDGAGTAPVPVLHKEQQLASPKATVQKITIVYGTETGNSKRLATEFAAKAKKNGILVKIVGMDQYRLTDLPKEEYFLALTSTHGDGEPPAAAKKFYEYIHQTTVALSSLKFSVLALGDTSYPLFCQTGEDMDKQFEKLGGQRIAPLQKCDLEYEEDANKWFASVLHALNTTTHKEQINQVIAVTTEIKKSTGKKTYIGNIITNINLNARGSNKETHHIEIVADDLEYLPGDSIGIVPENPQWVVEGIIALTGIQGNKEITFKKDTGTVYDLLTKKINIHYLLENTIKKYAAIIQQDIPIVRMDLLDLLKIYPTKDAAQFEEVLGILNPIPPRLYTVSSSPNAHSGEVHVTVVKDIFHVDETEKNGLCSNYLSLFSEGASLPFFVQPNKRFKLPEAHKDIIMIGPGTGIAPFRSFVAERDATGATGRNWLFFGEQHFTTDFLYQTEWQNWYSTGVLTKVSLAFSRDQEGKLYVQHKMLQQARELFEWIKGGAYVYICGNKERMSVDVEKAFLEIIAAEGNLSEADAVKYLHNLEEEGRYEKDVY
ncbi:sulfite reductase flavoprotein subunit alpha [Parasediminibacterium sp. JCM 36343]|uniref:diflavin oxidoreductase n=1 Tax=Parasediminibacterium sp. JCM 36343 TaxID=3374279 RepID=UPI0039783F00